MKPDWRKIHQTVIIKTRDGQEPAWYGMDTEKLAGVTLYRVTVRSDKDSILFVTHSYTTSDEAVAEGRAWVGNDAAVAV